ncbi:XRE family transcriptional regulator [Eubacterium sp. TM05-53]|nr:XRE family transcriptional regulator [Eubacterium sp. TM05-53]
MKEKQIIAALAYAHKNQQDIADTFGCTKQNVSTRIKREKLSDDELEKIAKTIGAKYKCYFEFEDGTKI